MLFRNVSADVIFKSGKAFNSRLLTGASYAFLLKTKKRAKSCYYLGCSNYGLTLRPLTKINRWLGPSRDQFMLQQQAPVMVRIL